ncbi:MAG TPA: hypothetical protein VIN93_13015 [Bryobacteraceae bacterium]|jgi:hypothetical protein
MEESHSKPDAPNLLGLGSLLGQSQAFGIVAGRCSAAQAACLHRLRQTNEFQRVTPRWREFCSQHLGIDGRNADKIISLWEEFGAAYFELAQLAPIPPNTYRALAPSIRDGALHFNGEVIELIPENSRRLAAAVAELRRAAPPASPSRQLAPHEQLAALGERCITLAAELQRFSNKERCGENWLQFTAMFQRLSAALNRIERENGLR